MVCVTLVAACALSAVFHVCVPLIKSDHKSSVSLETSCRIPDIESTVIGVKLSKDRVDGSSHGRFRGEMAAAVVRSSFVQRCLIRWYDRRRVSSSTAPFICMSSSGMSWASSRLGSNAACIADAAAVRSAVSTLVSSLLFRSISTFRANSCTCFGSVSFIRVQTIEHACKPVWFDRSQLESHSSPHIPVTGLSQ